VWTTLRFPNTGGTHGIIHGTYSAFQLESALEMSVLGYDVLHLCALIVDHAGNTVCLLSPPTCYIIRDS
jgi:hypothetical protein